MHELNFYCHGIFKLIPKRENASVSPGIKVENNDTSVA